jgi:ABC-type antimicrobial peptide transport system permease subunit
VVLGAGSGEIVRLVLRQGLALAVGGILIGMGGAVAATRTLVSLIRGVEPNHSAPFIAVALLLPAVTWAASYLPARRAARVDR